ncbi:MAG TPA: acyl carrier protein [Candidatus Andersenbacteria bacterium]|nr:acyl carrier protein [Candidatus Andersenbacteria bacterium]
MAQSWTSELIFEKVVIIIKEAMDNDNLDITLTDKLAENIGAESLDFADISMRTVLKFGLRMESSVLEALIFNQYSTVEDLCKAVAERLEVQWTAPHTSHA